jgi:hypothetical protein
MKRKLEHHMLLDAKKVEDLGLGDYLSRAHMAKTQQEIERVYRDLIEDLAACDVSKDYEEKDPHWNGGES